jgi:hypothetical protein
VREAMIMENEGFKFNAKSYYLAYICLMEKNKELSELYSDKVSIYVLPAITLAAFSCEIALKCRIMKGIFPPKTHDLVTLLDKLTPSEQDQIVNQTIELYNKKAEILNTSDFINKDRFRVVLIENRNVFTDYRYVFDKKLNYTVDLDFLEAFMFCLNDYYHEYENFVFKLTNS